MPLPLNLLLPALPPPPPPPPPPPLMLFDPAFSARPPTPSHPLRSPVALARWWPAHPGEYLLFGCVSQLLMLIPFVGLLFYVSNICGESAYSCHLHVASVRCSCKLTRRSGAGAALWASELEKRKQACQHGLQPPPLWPIPTEALS